jgi:hypothetical protein
MQDFSTSLAVVLNVFLGVFISHIRPIVFQTEIADVRQTLLGFLFIAECYSS